LSAAVEFDSFWDFVELLNGDAALSVLEFAFMGESGDARASDHCKMTDNANIIGPENLSIILTAYNYQYSPEQQLKLDVPILEELD
jgi:hypothetical protein